MTNNKEIHLILILWQYSIKHSPKIFPNVILNTDSSTLENVRSKHGFILELGHYGFYNDETAE